MIVWTDFKVNDKHTNCVVFSYHKQKQAREKENFPGRQETHESCQKKKEYQKVDEYFY